jgi:hypothetical protein
VTNNLCFKYSGSIRLAGKVSQKASHKKSLINASNVVLLVILPCDTSEMNQSVSVGGGRGSGEPTSPSVTFQAIQLWLTGPSALTGNVLLWGPHY